jgi:hypothetical protein
MHLFKTIRNVLSPRQESKCPLSYSLTVVSAGEKRRLRRYGTEGSHLGIETEPETTDTERRKVVVGGALLF